MEDVIAENNRINILIDNDSVGSFLYLNIKRQKECFLLTFNEGSFIKDFIIDKDMEIDIHISLSSHCRTAYALRPYHIEKGSFKTYEFEVALDSVDDLKPRITDFYLSLLRSWQTVNSEYDWRNLCNYKKRVWVNASLDWSGITKNISPKYPILFNCNEIKTKLDIYCYLGEIFVGAKGYFGKDLYGISDCLTYLDTKSKGKRSICFMNIDILYDVCKGEKYVNDLIDIFQSADFEVKL